MNEKSFVSIGIDISKEFLDVHVLPTDQTFRLPRTDGGLADLIARLTPLPPDVIILEATGGFDKPVTAALLSANLPVAVINPRQVRDFARATGRLAKTDQLDALVIAQFGAAIRPELRPLPDQERQSLDELMTRRRQVLAMINAEKNRKEPPEIKNLERRSTTTSKPWKNTWRKSTRTSTILSRTRPPGASRRSC